ncbi:MAG: NAD(P)/FAD-dependent oxidoreductase [Deferribacterales bacterium]
MYDVIVTGGGAAGLMAAGFAAKEGAKVLVAEKMVTCGRKLLISGSGRCNITNTIKDTKQFVAKFGKNGRFLYQAINSFTTSDVVSFFNSKGLKTAVEKNFKVFPAGDAGSADVLRVLMGFCVSGGVEFLSSSPVTKINTADGRIISVTAGGRDIECNAAVIACGGKSYPATGSSGDGYALASALGHTIAEPRPVLVPAYSDSEWIKDLQGVSLRDIRLTLFSAGKNVASADGDLVFTDKGVSGPAVYDITRYEFDRSADNRLMIDLLPLKSATELDAELELSMRTNNKKILKNIIDECVMSSLVPAVFAVSGIDPMLKASNLSKKDRNKLVSAVKGLELSGVNFAGFERAVVTAGGVKLKEIDGRSMSSTIVDGLFFAGEVMDLDAPTGGYNLQMCWSTGRLAGISCAEYAKKKI